MFNSIESSWTRVFAVVLSAFVMLVAPAARAQFDPPELPGPLLEPAVSLTDVALPPGLPDSQLPCAEFGCYNGSVLDGDTVAARGDEFPLVYVFTRAADGTVGLQTLLSNPELSDPSEDFEFGFQLALSGDVLLASGTAQNVPKLYVFRRRGATWTYQQTLPGPALGLLISHRAVFVGTGADVRVYEPNLRGVFRQTVTLKPPVAEANSTFGASLSFDGLTALVGSPGNSAAYAFDRFFAIWVLVQKFAPAGGVSGVAVDRDRIAIGAPGTPGVLPNRPGAVQTYVRRGWQWRASDLIANPIPEDDQLRGFGAELDLQGSRLLVSGYVNYPYAPWAPMNYLFDVRGTPRIVTVLDAGSARSVKLSGNTALIDQQSIRLGTYPVIFDLPN